MTDMQHGDVRTYRGEEYQAIEIKGNQQFQRCLYCDFRGQRNQCSTPEMLKAIGGCGPVHRSDLKVIAFKLKARMADAERLRAKGREVTVLRKMWSGTEVQKILNGLADDLEKDRERLQKAARNFLDSRDIAETVKSARNQDMAFGDEVPDYREDCERLAKAADELEAAIKSTRLE